MIVTSSYRYGNQCFWIWIGLDWIGLDWIGLDWIGLDHHLVEILKSIDDLALQKNKIV